MAIQEVELHLITDSPWQTRPLDDEHVQTLAVDIAERGLLQPAVGRVHPQRPEYIQLATGHHRLAAFRLLRQEVFDKHKGPDDPGPLWAALPIDVRELTDLQMAQAAIAENYARKDLTAVEKAQTLQRLIREFNLQQAEAGKSFGLSQSAVANLLRLLKLPEPIQAHVQSGALPERLARQLVSVSKIYPAEALKMAEAVAKAEPDGRDAAFTDAEDDFERDKGVQLYGIPWKLEWPAKPIQVEGHKSLSEIPACKGCEFYRKTDYGPGTCLRKECYVQKKIEHAWTQVPAAAKKSGFPVGKRGVSVVDLIPTGADEKYLERATKSKHASLVVVPAPREGDWRSNGVREKLLGSMWLTVATTDLLALEAAVPRPKEVKAKTNGHVAPARDWKSEQAEHERNRKAAKQVVAELAPQFGPAMPENEVLQQFILRVYEDNYGYNGGGLADYQKATTPRGRQAAFALVLLDEVFVHYALEPKELVEMREGVTALAKGLKVRLAPDWDAALIPPAPAAKLVPGSAKPNPNSKASAAAAARAQVLRQAAAKAGHVHRHTAVQPSIGHSRPAPKPSQMKKTDKRKTAKKGTR